MANWQCPYCGKHQAAVRERANSSAHQIGVHGYAKGETGIVTNALVCSNDACRQMTLTATLREFKGYKNGNFIWGAAVASWSLMPEASARTLPDYIPAPIKRDYEEACRIRLLSSTASATLSRRCLQGMIRDFCGITEKRLVDEIDALRHQVDEGKAPRGVQADTIDAIDHVRKIGNIGAHMETDINLIVDVDPDEAQQLIALLELLVDDWYVARHDREERLNALKKLGQKKAAEKKVGGTP